MRNYKITAYVGLETHSKVIKAKNSYDANQIALSYGHKLSNYGRAGFFRGVSVKAIKFIKDGKGNDI